MTAHIRVSVEMDSAADRATRMSADDIQARRGLGLEAHMRDLGFDLLLIIESDSSSEQVFCKLARLGQAKTCSDALLVGPIHGRSEQ